MAWDLGKERPDGPYVMDRPPLPDQQRGYAIRCSNCHRAAMVIARDHDPIVPDDPTQIVIAHEIDCAWAATRRVAGETEDEALERQRARLLRPMLRAEERDKLRRQIRLMGEEPIC